MLARLQQFITLLLVFVAASWAAHFLQKGQTAWAGAGAALILMAYALFLAAEFLLLARFSQSEPAPPPSAIQLLQAWGEEVLTAPQVFCWRQPFRSRAEADFTPAEAVGRRGVLLVHGFVCNRAFWNPWMTRLRAAQIPFVAVNLEPVFGSLDHYPQIIDEAVRRLEAVTRTPPVIVAHSMGGLAARAWMAACADDDRVHHVITIGTPHHGTRLARFGHTTNGRQMRIGSDWLTRLARRELPSRWAKFTCFYSHCDNIVFPVGTATLPGAKNLHIPGAAHVHLAFHDEVFDEALTRLTDPGPASASPAA